MSDNQDAVGIPPVPSDEEGLSGSANESAQEQPDYTPSSESRAGEVHAADEGDQQQAEEDATATEDVEDASAQRTGMTDVFSEEYTYQEAKRGEIRQAQVIAVRDDGVMVDLGLKREGLIPGYDLQRVGSDTAEALSIGDEIPVFIVRPEDREGNIVVSWYRARQEQDWLDAQQLTESGEVWEGKVKGYNRGGLIVPFGKIRGFVPASHVTGISRRMDHATLQARLAEKVGQTLPLKVIEVNRQNRRLILSERVARRQWRARQRERLLGELQQGDRVHGVVSNICDFGAFVDIGGTDGLVHISEISWRRTNHPSEVLNVGEKVDAYVLRVDRERKRIGLSLRLLEPDPWESAEENYHVGQLVTGVVTKLTDFGAFAALEDGIEGLIHISELADIPPKHPSEAVARGAEVPLLVVKVDSRRRRMGLSLKRVSEDEWYQWEEERRLQAAAAEPEPEEEPPTEEAAPAVEVEAEPVESAVVAEAETTELLADAEADVEIEAEEVETEAAVTTEELESSEATDAGESQPPDETVADVAEVEQEAEAAVTAEELESSEATDAGESQPPDETVADVAEAEEEAEAAVTTEELQSSEATDAGESQPVGETEADIAEAEEEAEAAVTTEELQSSEATDSGEPQPLDETEAGVAEAEEETEAAVTTEELESSEATDGGEPQPLDETVAGAAETEEETEAQPDAIGQELAAEPTTATGGTE